MKAKHLYSVLGSALEPALAAYGFRKQPASRLVFQRTVGDVFHSVWFKTDKYGWDAYAGGSFFITFTVSESHDVESVVRREERLNFFMTDAELISAREYQDGIIARIPKPPESYFQTLDAGFRRSVSAESAASLIATVRGYFDPEPAPFQRHQDFALRYWREEDVAGWAPIIQSVIPRAVAQMESWTLPTRRST
jgi:hypothetical protein